MQSRLSVSITGNIYAKWAFSVILKLGYFAPAVSCKYYRKHLRKAGIFCNWEIIYVITAENAARRAKLEGRRRAAGGALFIQFKKSHSKGPLCPLNSGNRISREWPFPSNHKKHLLRDFFLATAALFSRIRGHYYSYFQNVIGIRGISRQALRFRLNLNLKMLKKVP